MMTVLEAHPFYPWLAAASLALLTALTILAWRRRFAPGAVPFILFTVMTILWVISNTLSLAATTDSGRFFWFKLEKSLILPIVTAQFCFALEYAWANSELTRRALGWLMALPLVFAVLIWTNATHHLVWTHVWIDRSIQFKLGPIHWAAIVYALALSLGHLAAMGRLFVRSPRHRWIAAGLFAAPLLSRLGGVLNVSGLNPFEPLNPMILTLNITLIPYALALFRFGMFDVLPVARDTVIERMSEGMLVLDAQKRVADMNDAAGRLLGLSGKKVLGQRAGEVLHEALEAQPDLLPMIGNPETPSRDLSFRSSPHRCYQASTSPLADRRGGLLGYVIWFRDVSHERDAQKKILEQQRALAMFEERELLARELHDGIGQLLAAAHLQAKTAEALLARGDADRSATCLLSVARTTQEAKESIRDYLLGVKDGPSGELDIEAILSRYLQHCARDYGFLADLVVSPELLKAGQINPAVEARTVPIIQEALTNVRRHGGGASARVTIDMDNGHLLAVIENAGPGFDPESSSVRQGYGLRSMRGRAEAAGGTVAVVSTPGEGTRVTIRIPLNKEKP